VTTLQQYKCLAATVTESGLVSDVFEFQTVMVLKWGFVVAQGHWYCLTLSRAVMKVVTLSMSRGFCEMFVQNCNFCIPLPFSGSGDIHQDVQSTKLESVCSSFIKKSHDFT